MGWEQYCWVGALSTLLVYEWVTTRIRTHQRVRREAMEAAAAKENAERKREALAEEAYRQTAPYQHFLRLKEFVQFGDGCELSKDKNDLYNPAKKVRLVGHYSTCHNFRFLIDETDLLEPLRQQEVKILGKICADKYCQIYYASCYTKGEKLN